MEAYDISFILDGIKDYVSQRGNGVFDGFEIRFPEGMNNLDPLLMIKHGSLDADFDAQVLLTKSSILNKKVEVYLFGDKVGDFMLNDINHSFAAFPVFEQYPMALSMLIKTCFVSVLKNLLPPLSASQRAVMEERERAKLEALRRSQGEQKAPTA